MWACWDCLAWYRAVKVNKPNQPHVELIETVMKSEKMLTPSLNSPTSDAVIETSSNEVLASYPIYSCISKLWFGFSNARPRRCEFGPHVAEVNCFLQEYDEPTYDVKSHEDDGDVHLTTHSGTSSLHELARESLSHWFIPPLKLSQTCSNPSSFSWSSGRRHCWW